VFAQVDRRAEDEGGPAASAAPAVRATGLRRTYGDVVALEHLDLEVAVGEFFTLLGPSGSGKTTTFTAGAQNTLPLWIFGNIRLGQQLPQVNVVVFLVIAITIVPVVLAQRLSRDTGVVRQGGVARTRA
jgi:ABC-type polar amino acid transport system ATPase subunit